MAKSNKSSQTTGGDSLQAMVPQLLNMLDKSNPKLAALCRQEIEEHKKAKAEERWKPLR